MDFRRDLWHIDVIRCRRSLLYEGCEWPVLCARDEWVQATPENAQTLDYIWVCGTTPGCLSKSLAKLPFQGSRFYHASAVKFMLQQHLITYAELGLGIRGSGRLPPEVFRAPLDRIEEALPEELRKGGGSTSGWAR